MILDGGRGCRARLSRLAVSAVAALLALAIAPSPARAAEPPASCSSVTVTVALAPGSLVHYQIAAELCVPPNPVRDTALVTVHGATYSRAYWDFPYAPNDYSFVRAANAAGYATLNIDRLGAGASAHPLSALVTLDREAYVGHQLVEALRSGALGHAWSRVALVGHSLGSVISIGQAATYHDVDGLVVTGYLHVFGLGLPMALPNVYPALLDPRFITAGLDPGYVTTQPGTRGSLFYYLANTSASVVAADEAVKDTVTLTELAGLELMGNQAVSLAIDAPVLSVVGDHDTLFCLALPCGDALNALTLEPLAYSPAAELETVVVGDAGHDLNLHLNAQEGYAAIIEWLNSRFPPL